MDPHIDSNVKSNDGGFSFELPALVKLGRVNDQGWNGSTPIMEKETSIKELLPKQNKERENVPRRPQQSFCNIGSVHV